MSIDMGVRHLAVAVIEFPSVWIHASSMAVDWNTLIRARRLPIRILDWMIIDAARAALGPESESLDCSALPIDVQTRVVTIGLRLAKDRLLGWNCGLALIEEQSLFVGAVGGKAASHAVQALLLDWTNLTMRVEIVDASNKLRVDLSALASPTTAEEFVRSTDHVFELQAAARLPLEEGAPSSSKAKGERKAMAIARVRLFLHRWAEWNATIRDVWLPWFEAQTKQDDLADCLLQALAFLGLDALHSRLRSSAHDLAIRKTKEKSKQRRRTAKRTRARHTSTLAGDLARLHSTPLEAEVSVSSTRPSKSERERKRSRPSSAIPVGSGTDAGESAPKRSMFAVKRDCSDLDCMKHGFERPKECSFATTSVDLTEERGFGP